MNVEQQKNNILLGGVQTRTAQAIDRHKSIDQSKTAKVVHLQRNKFENSQSNESRDGNVVEMEHKKSGKSVVVKDENLKVENVEKSESNSEVSYDIDGDEDEIGLMQSHIKSKQNMSMLSTTASTQSVCIEYG